MKTLKKVLSWIGRYRFLMVLSILLAAVSVVLQLYVPILFGNAIDGIHGKGSIAWDTVRFYLSRILIMIVISAFSTWLMNAINNHLAFRVVADIRARAFRQIQELPLSYLDAHSTGDIVSRVIADVDQLSDGLLLGFTQLFSGVITIFATLFFMFSRSIRITLLVIVLTPISFLAAKFIASRSFALFTKQSTIRGKQTALVEEMVSGQRIVRAFGYEEKAAARFDEINRDLVDCSMKATFLSSLTNPGTRFINSIIYAFVTLAGAFSILSGNLTVGGLSTLLYYSNQYMKPFNDISSVVTELQNALACAARIFALIEAEPQTPDPEKALARAEGSVSIEHADFSYDKERELIKDFNLQTKPGMTVAIVGPTGCGKTTLINLLMRFYDTDAGDIRIDGTSIYDVSRKSLRENFGMVLQETWLKHDTVRANLAVGRPDASDEEIIAAAKEAHIWDFIRRLPNGLDTILTDDSLSQGQKQLLCITRVMLALPPMLILDEATSSIDTRTELMIQEAFAKLMTGRTSFIVAHRLSTIRNADIILVMKDGHVIEQGNHDTLMEAGGFYASLYRSQFVQPGAGTADQPEVSYGL